MVSPTWHVEFSGVPEFVQQNNSYPDDYYAFQFYALPGETLTLRVTRPEPEHEGHASSIIWPRP